jgi:regulator of protease activity HflC (stomatin/prohibitin superfamily)
MRTLKSIILALLLVAALAAMAGCYVRSPVNEAERGLRSPDGASIADVVGPGLYTNMGMAAHINIVGVTSIPIHWEDQSALTADEQRISIKLDLTVMRKSDAGSLLNMWRNYNEEAKDDAALVALVASRIGPAVKAVTTALTLDNMLGLGDANTNRDTVGERVADILRPKLTECGVELVYLGVTDIDPSESYLKLREQKANAQMEGEVAQQKTAQMQEKLKQEQAQTEIDLELARRDNAVAEEKAKVYQDDRAYELERLRLLADVVGDSDKFYFVPDGTDLSFYVTGGYGVTPIQK